MAFTHLPAAKVLLIEDEPVLLILSIPDVGGRLRV